VIFPYMHTMYFDKIDSSITLSYLLPPLNNFNEFHLSIFIHGYEVL
jgi:hypothetical protein